MPGFSEFEASKAAVEIITAGLSSGTIKLQGNGGNPQATGNSDGDYLASLFNKLVRDITNGR